MKHFLLFVVLMALVWTGCGGKKSTTTQVAITISPTTASIAGGATTQFTATVTGTTNTAVNWAVNGEVGGDALIGTVSTTGLYSAPNVLPTTKTVNVTATAQADTTQIATAVVTLTAPTVTISISPTSANVPAGGTQQFTPTVTASDNNTAVTWSITGCSVGAACGAVSSTGLYTAPLSPPKESITVTATSQSNSSFSKSAPITVQFGNASLNGTYVFLVAQPDNSSGSGFSYRGGTFVADGNGNITGGVTDANSSTSGPLTNVAIVASGSMYSVGADGRGTTKIVDANGSHAFSFALTSSTRGQIIQFDSSGVSSGFIRQQDQKAISSVGGAFVFNLAGDNAGPSAAVGQLSFSGTAITGTEDSSTNGNVTQGAGLTGSFALGTGGRGTATINTSLFAFYVVDASTLVLIDVDGVGSPRLAGTAYAQSGTFTNASLLSSAFLVSGNAVSGNKPYALAGRFDASSGSGTFTNGFFDVNNGGTVTANSSFASGASYNQTGGTGRYQISTGTSSFILWLASSKLGVIMEADTTPVGTATGLLFQQQTGFQSVTGGFEFAVGGASADGTTAQASAAQITTNGFGILPGTQDTNISGQTPQSAALTTNSQLAIASSTTGRGTAPTTISVPGSSLNYTLYFVTPDRFIMLSATPNGPVLSGIAERQCSDCSF